MNTRGKYKLRTYGHPYRDEDYDYLFGFLRSKDKKKKDALEIQQKQANVQLTMQRQLQAKQQIAAEASKAKAEEARAFAAQKQAEKAAVQLQGAHAMKNLTYLGFAIGAIVIIGGVAMTIYMIKQGKKSALIAAKVAKAKQAATAG